MLLFEFNFGSTSDPGGVIKFAAVGTLEIWRAMKV